MAVAGGRRNSFQVVDKAARGASPREAVDIVWKCLIAQIFHLVSRSVSGVSPCSGCRGLVLFHVFLWGNGRKVAIDQLAAGFSLLASSVGCVRFLASEVSVLGQFILVFQCAMFFWKALWRKW